MNGVDMCIDHLDQAQVELFEQLQVAPGLFENRVDQQGFAAGPAGKQIGVGRGGLVEKLSEKHDPFSRFTGLAHSSAGWRVCCSIWVA
jgi:hypothetical protein